MSTVSRKPARGRRIAAALASISILSIALTACTAGGDTSPSAAATNSQGSSKSTGSPGSPGGPAPTATTGTASIVLPLSAYVPSGFESHTYNLARQILVNACMTKFGFPSKTVITPFTQADAEISSPSANAWGITDLDDARKYGYHASLTPAAVAHAKELADREAVEQSYAPTTKTEEEAEHRVLTGVDDDGSPLKDASIPKGGCTGEVSRELSNLTEDEFVITLENEDTVLTDPSVVKVFAAWSVCMAKQGYHYKTPWDPVNNEAWNGDLHPTP